VSFHETKNVVCGEGGALLVNDARLAERAETIREKGTDRSRFLRGQVDKYTWVDIGSSFLPSDLTAAFLYAQMQEADEITRRRREVWSWYDERFEALEQREGVRRPTLPHGCEHNAHMFYVLVRNLETRTRVLSYLNANGVNAIFHYVPLHSSAAGRRYGRVAGSMRNTDAASERLIRLPLWVGMNQDDVDRVATLVERALRPSG
jgi:dTDP-4-amino-4,6-dideoxygalactose transaminase